MIYIRSSQGFAQYQKIELPDSLSKAGTLTINDKKIKYKRLNTFYFVMRRYSIGLLIALFLFLIMGLSYPLIALVYFFVAVFIFWVLESLHALKYLPIISLLNYSLHALIFYFALNDSKNYGFFESNTILLGAFSIHILLLCFEIYRRYSPVYEASDLSQEEIWYFWKNKDIV